MSIEIEKKEEENRAVKAVLLCYVGELLQQAKAPNWPGPPEVIAQLTELEEDIKAADPRVNSASPCDVD